MAKMKTAGMSRTGSRRGAETLAGGRKASCRRHSQSWAPFSRRGAVLAVVLVWPLCALPGAAAPEPGRAEVEQRLEESLSAMAELRQNGGWGMAYTLDGKVMWGEWRPIALGCITVQPPATPSLALAYLRAGTVLGEARWIGVARDARDALLAVQTREGGFPQDACPGAKLRPRTATLDDATTTGALHFFLDWWRHTGAPEDRANVVRVGEFLLESQFPCGGWPQRYPLPKNNYGAYITFNDNVMSNAIHALLALHDALGEKRFLDAAMLGGACILQLQGGPGERCWAQQYDPETMAPAAARAFEPAGYSAGESAAVCDLLLELYARSGDKRFLDAVRGALEWYKSAQLPNGKWARLYEPGTGKPIYGLAEGGTTYRVEEARGGYSWQGNYYPHRAAARLKEIEKEKAGDAKAIMESPAQQLKRLAPKAAAALSAPARGGLYTSAMAESERAMCIEQGGNPDQPVVRARDFVNNTGVLLDYLTALGAGE